MPKQIGVLKTPEQKKAEKRARRLKRKEGQKEDRIARQERAFADPSRVNHGGKTAPKPEEAEERRGKWPLPDRYQEEFQVEGVPKDVSTALWRAGALVWIADNWMSTSVRRPTFEKLWGEFATAAAKVKKPKQNTAAFRNLELQFQLVMADLNEPRMTCLAFSILSYVWQEYRKFYGSPAPGLWNTTPTDFELKLRLREDYL